MGECASRNCGHAIYQFGKLGMLRKLREFGTFVGLGMSCEFGTFVEFGKLHEFDMFGMLACLVFVGADTGADLAYLASLASCANLARLLS